jgi:poly(hydroxyalkanoate) depolymerase family esterase
MSILKYLISLLVSLILVFSQYSYAQFLELKDFADNPGNLAASYFSPDSDDPSIVVLLHGCAQEGEAFAVQSGLFGLAKKHGFALLIPQQSSDNNIKRCFNWYSSNDYTKDFGENLSIKNMIVRLKKQLGSERVYILGLSAGGAMASNLLVNYPELFNAGAIVAGIPFPCADGLITAISCMKNGPSQTAGDLAMRAKKSSPKQKNWPKLSVWSGGNDEIVNPLNATTLAQYWATLSGITLNPHTKNNKGYTVKSWENESKITQVELIIVDDLGHGIMVNPKEINGGIIADYLLLSPISSTKHIIDFWQLSSNEKITKSNLFL